MGYVGSRAPREDARPHPDNRRGCASRSSQAGPGTWRLRQSTGSRLLGCSDQGKTPASCGATPARVVDEPRPRGSQPKDQVETTCISDDQGPAFVDTNVLVQAFGKGASPRKTAASGLITHLMKENRLRLSTQVLQELSVPLTRKPAAPFLAEEAATHRRTACRHLARARPRSCGQRWSGSGRWCGRRRPGRRRPRAWATDAACC